MVRSAFFHTPEPVCDNSPAILPSTRRDERRNEDLRNPAWRDRLEHFGHSAGMDRRAAQRHRPTSILRARRGAGGCGVLADLLEPATQGLGDGGDHRRRVGTAAADASRGSEGKILRPHSGQAEERTLHFASGPAPGNHESQSGLPFRRGRITGPFRGSGPGCRERHRADAFRHARPRDHARLGDGCDHAPRQASPAHRGAQHEAEERRIAMARGYFGFEDLRERCRRVRTMARARYEPRSSPAS